MDRKVDSEEAAAAEDEKMKLAWEEAKIEQAALDEIREVEEKEVADWWREKSATYWQEFREKVEQSCDQCFPIWEEPEADGTPRNPWKMRLVAAPVPEVVPVPRFEYYPRPRNPPPPPPGGGAQTIRGINDGSATWRNAPHGVETKSIHPDLACLRREAEVEADGGKPEGVGEEKTIEWF